MARSGHKSHPRRLPTRPGHRSRQHLHLRELDLRPGRRRRPARRIRVRPHRQPDPTGPGGSTGRWSRKPPTGVRSVSGMAATDCALRAVLRPGDHVVILDDAYGGTFRLIDKVFPQWGITHTPVPLSDLDAVRSALTPRTRLIWVETPTNPC